MDWKTIGLIVSVIVSPILVVLLQKGGPILLRYLRQTSEDERREQDIRDRIIKDGAAQVIAQLDKQLSKQEAWLTHVMDQLEQSRQEHLQCMVAQAALREQNKAQQSDIDELRAKVAELRARQK